VYRLRAATLADLPQLQELVADSVRGLSAPYYTREQVESGLRHVFGIDTQLIADGSYYVVEADGAIVAAGGWSARETLHGGDQAKTGDDPLLDPATEPARIRAFFVHPDFARRGLARRLYRECEAAAWSAGFRRFELVATRPGEPLYTALGFVVLERDAVKLPAGIDIPCARMTRAIEPAAEMEA
jgi:GNAT superfamily N-acetyltransferase